MGVQEHLHGTMDVSRLHKSIREGDVDAVRFALENNAPVNQIYCRHTALSFALESGKEEIVKLIWSHPQFNPNAKNHFDQTPLFCAAKLGHIDLVKYLLTLNVDVDQADLEGVTPLGATTWNNHSTVAKSLILAGADLNRCNKRGESPLLRACSSAAVDVAKVLLQNGCDVNMPTLDFRTPLFECIPSSFSTRDPTTMINILNLLIKHKCDVNARDIYGNTCLHLAVERNQLLSACILAENRCDMTLTNNDGLTAFHIALSPGRQNYRLASCLILYGCNLHAIFPEIESDSGPLAKVLQGMATPETFPKASSAERRMLLKLLLHNIDQHHVSNDTLQKLLDRHIQKHGFHSDVESIRKFCQDKCPDSLKDISRRIIRRILGQGVIQKTDSLPLGSSLKQYLTFGLNCHGKSPTRALELQMAIQNGSADKVSELVKSDVDVNFPFLGETPLAVAVEKGQDHCVDMLREARADPNVQNLEGDSVLHIAAKFGRESMIDFFIRCGCEHVNLKNKKGNLPIHYACQNGKFSAVQLLLKNGSLASRPDDMGIYPIHYVTACGDVETLRYLLTKELDVNVTDSFGNTPLHLAASNGLLYLKQNICLPSLYSSELMMNLDMMNIMYSDRKSIGTGAQSRHHGQVVRELINAGGDTCLSNKAGQTATHVAQEFRCLHYFQMDTER